MYSETKTAKLYSWQSLDPFDGFKAATGEYQTHFALFFAMWWILPEEGPTFPEDVRCEHSDFPMTQYILIRAHLIVGVLLFISDNLL